MRKLPEIRKGTTYIQYNKNKCHVCGKVFKLGEKVILVTDYKTDEVVIGSYPIVTNKYCSNCFESKFNKKVDSNVIKIDKWSK